MHLSGLLIALLLCCQIAPAWAEVGAGDTAPDGREQAASISPHYLLMNPQGRAVTNEDFPGRFQLVTFGFISCPDVCPTTLLGFRNVLQLLGDQAARLQPIFITVDPERDTGEIMRAYTAAFDPRIVGLTASPELVRRAADSFGVRYEKVREPGAKPDSYTMNHTAGMFLLDTRGGYLARFSYELPANEIAQRIRQFLATGAGQGLSSSPGLPASTPGPAR